jgi:hypothetical protein
MIYDFAKMGGGFGSLRPLQATGLRTRSALQSRCLGYESTIKIGPEITTPLHASRRRTAARLLVALPAVVGASDQFAQQRIERFGLLCRKPVAERALDRGRINSPHAPAHLPASRGDDNDLSAAVVVARAPRHVTGAFDPVDQTREVVLRQQNLTLKFARPQAPVAGAFQFQERIIPGQRWQLGGLQGVLDGKKRTLLRFDQTRPGAHYGIALNCIALNPIARM